jgi:hypothetical protein
MEKIKKVVDGVEVWVVVEADGSETVIGPVDEAKSDPAADTTKGLTEEERIAAAIDARLKPIKEKLDKAYEARDAALKENTELKAKARDMELKALRDSGQEKEALTLELEELRRENENLRSSNTTLTRDTAIREALSGLKFRNEKASQLAFKDIANVLKKGEAESRKRGTPRSGTGRAGSGSGRVDQSGEAVRGAGSSRRSLNRIGYETARLGGFHSRIPRRSPYRVSAGRNSLPLDTTQQFWYITPGPHQTSTAAT